MRARNAADEVDGRSLVCGSGLPSASSKDGAFSPVGIVAEATLADGAAALLATGAAEVAATTPASDAEPAELTADGGAALATADAGAELGALVGATELALLDSWQPTSAKASNDAERATEPTRNSTRRLYTDRGASG